MYHAYCDDTLQVPIQSVDVLENLLHALPHYGSTYIQFLASSVIGIWIGWELITYNGDFPNQFFALLLEDGGGCSASTGAGGGIEPSHVWRLSVAQDELVNLVLF